MIETSTLLPDDAVEQLKTAANKLVTKQDPLARIKAIEEATQKIKRKYPQFFKDSLPAVGGQD